MSSRPILHFLLSLTAASFVASAQTPPPAQQPAPQQPAPQQQAAPTGQQPIAASLGVIVYPAKGQPAATQSKDENECYGWAKQQTNIDPAKPQQVVVATPPPVQGGAVKGAAKGAAGGAAIGAIAGDTGEGAAIGAVAGAAKGRRAQKQANAAAQQQAQQQAQQISQAQKDQFKKAFSACMEGRGYSIK
ncbi:MAG: hypothetical protein IT186_14235 [Acidobacteria bacterium]|nr:hypothetical protein [Acidobacteriota bacterium]